MTRRAAVVAGVVLAAAVARGQTPPQTFRSTTDLVMVDASVREGGTMVAGLTAADFVLTDNGVPQRITSVEASAVPIDVTLVVDVSGDPRSPWVTHPERDAARDGAALDDEVGHVTSLLRPDDRVRLLAIDTYTRQLFPRTAPARVSPIHVVDAGGLSSLYDTLMASLLEPVQLTRRHVVIARTKGRDSISAVDAAAVRDAARHSDALLHIVMMEKAVDNEDQLYALQCPTMGYCWPTRRFWVPFVHRSMAGAPFHTLTPEGETLAQAAGATGGVMHQAEMFTEPTLTGTFRQVFDDFRASYVLRYSPQGVKPEGWHDIEVTVPSHKSATVRARKGYAIESAAPAVPKASPASTAPPKTIQDFTAAYERGDFAPVTRGLQSVADPAKLIRDFNENGNPWPATPHREAALVLELAEAGAFSHRDAARDEAQKLLARFTRFVRPPLEPDEFERAWTWAEVAILEGTIRPGASAPIVAKAMARFPDDPRFVLARAIMTDQLFPFAGAVRTSAMTADGQPTSAHIDAVIAQYMDATTSADTAAEARLRLAWFLHRIGRNPDALAMLDAVSDEQAYERPLKYLRQLFRGHTLASLDRIDDAIEAFRSAGTLWPNAQSAKVALMNALLHKGDRAGAEALADDIQTAAQDLTDPWWTYWQGDYRHYQRAISRVRELIQ